ncbi:MAG TPA: UDP-N-acetylmuramate--L-alanine ligase [Rhabdochlamydiaceae bacterium]|nr:UDP-N-acetylmuramate--L-alanine ligase [Rhabdochlamydiaceae bacterium]
MKYHFIGIGGIGMSALAHILLKRGAKVQGTDVAASYVTQRLQKVGAEVYAGHSADYLKTPCITIYSTAIKADHPEYKAAIDQKFPILHRSDLLAELMQGYRPLLVAGTHGKTTTSCLLTQVLDTANLNPTFALGGIALNFNSNGDQGSGEYFVAEADESDGTFLKYPSYGAIITNVEEDHLDYWKTGEALIEGFKQFAQKPSLLWWCADDPILSSLSLRGHSYGFSSKAHLQIKNWKQDGFKLIFTLAFQGKTYSDVELALIGKHNVANGAAVFGMALELGISETTIRRAFKTFKGVKRRLEKKGEKRAVSFYDDYAHHPTEIRTTLKGTRKAIGERRLVVAFQPHRYTRVRDCWKEFISAFDDADVVFMTDIWSAGEKPIEGITTEKLFEQIKSDNPFPVFYHPRAEYSAAIASYLRPHDVVLSIGAGDITEVCTEILQHDIKPFRLAVCQGGKSAEHEVALSSGKVLMSQMNPDYYTILPFTITKEGIWTREGKTKTLPEIVQELLTCDLAFPVFHGPFGEDGTLQGFFETLGLPYVGADYRSCAISMDKALTKHLAARHGVEVARFMEFSMHEWEQHPEETLHKILKEFTFPFYVKALHLGSTIGVHRIKNEQQIKEALEDIRRLDYSFLVEEEVQGRELEFGFIGNFDVAVADPAEVTRSEEVHTYENKYSATGMPSIPKAPMPLEVLARGKVIALKVYHAVGCTGLARIDFFLKSDGTWVLNEVNPMPGFTPTSVYPVIWKSEDVPMNEVIDRMIIAGLHRHRYYDRHLRPPAKPPVDL